MTVFDRLATHTLRTCLRAALMALVAALLLAPAGCVRPPRDTAPGEASDLQLSAGALLIKPAACDFGTVQQNDIRSATLSATNTGTEPVRLIALGGT